MILDRLDTQILNLLQQDATVPLRTLAEQVHASAATCQRRIAQLKARGIIEYAPCPPALEGKYQHFTQADVSGLREAGYGQPFLSVEEGVSRYVRYRWDPEETEPLAGASMG